MSELTLSLTAADMTMALWLSLTSIAGWFVSTLAGGGSSLILMPMIGLFLGTGAIPPVVTTGGIFGNIERAFVYRKSINWLILQWELPGAIVGGCLGAFILSKIEIKWLSVLVGLFLVGSAINYIFKRETSSFLVRPWYFLPAGFIYAFLSGAIGSMGPIIAPFYLNYGLKKEELLATQATTRLTIHLVKIAAYSIFGILTLPYLMYGILMGIAAFPGNWLGHLALEKISEQSFRQLVICFIMFSGILMLWQERQLVLF